MKFEESIRICFRKYTVFSGCASRSEFWWFVLFTILGSIALEVISDEVSLVFGLVTLLPGCAVTSRRLHDTEKSGWMQLVGIIPLLGWILIIVWCTQVGTRPNRYCGASGQGVDDSL